MVHALSAILRCDVPGFPATINLASDCTTVVIGRSRNADYRVEHPQVSGLQCTLTLRGGRLTLRDTSTNGTYVNGSLIERNETIELLEGPERAHIPRLVEEWEGEVELRFAEASEEAALAASGRSPPPECSFQRREA